jgi:hypothetical protein
MRDRYSSAAAGSAQYPLKVPLPRTDRPVRQRRPPLVFASATLPAPVTPARRVAHANPRRRRPEPSRPAAAPAQSCRCAPRRRDATGPGRRRSSESGLRKGVSDDAARLAFRIDEQLGARADATPLRCRIRRPALGGCAIHGQIAGALQRSSPAHGASPVATGWPLGVGRAAAGRSSTAPELTEGDGRMTTNTPQLSDERAENTQNLWHIRVYSPLPVPVRTTSIRDQPSTSLMEFI